METFRGVLPIFNKVLTQASYISCSFSFWHFKVVTSKTYRYMDEGISIFRYWNRLHNLLFPVSTTKGSDNYPKVPEELPKFAFVSFPLTLLLCGGLFFRLTFCRNLQGARVSPSEPPAANIWIYCMTLDTRCEISLSIPIHVKLHK
jgi:hypothetical protein